jgi:hypothetical protein
METDNKQGQEGNNSQVPNLDISLEGQFNPKTQESVNTEIAKTPDTSSITYGENTINSDGALVDAVGNVLMTKEQVAVKLGASPVEEEEDNTGGEDYSLDKDGNLLKDGKLFKQKGGFEVDENNEVTFKDAENTLINELLETARAEGFNLADAEGNPLAFEDTNEGVMQMARTIGEEFYNKQIVEFFQGYPIVADIVNHLSKGGDVTDFLSTYTENKDYAKLEVATDDKEGRKLVIKEYLTKVAKNDPETTNYLLKAIEASGDVDIKYNQYLAGLQVWQQEQDKGKKEAQRTEAQESKARTEAHWTQVKATITKGALGEFSLPDADKDEFFKFIANVADKKGNTKAALKYNNLGMEQKLMLDFLLYKDFDLNKLVEAKVKEKQVISLKGKKNKAIIINKTPAAVPVGAGTEISLNNIS